MDQNTENNGIKIQLSLASIMFFAPFVKNILSKGHLDISKNDKNFIQGYVRLGYLTLFMLLVSLTGLGIWYLIPNMIIYWIYIIGIGTLFVLLIFGSGAIIANISILQGNKKIFDFDNTDTTKKEILLSYLPLYNIYLRYKLHNFEHPYRWAKESILVRTLFVIITISTKNIVLGSFIIVIIIIRIVSLLGNIDFIDKEIKKKLNNVFLKNPEEIRAYFSGTIKYLYSKLIKKEEKKYRLFISDEKKIYGELKNIKKSQIILQYLIGILLLIGWFSIGSFDILSWIYFLPIILIIGRYSVMMIKWKHLPNLPLAKEISDLLIKINNKISLKIKK